MAIALIALLTWFQARATIVCGNVAYYAPAVMEGVVLVRSSEECEKWGRCVPSEVVATRGDRERGGIEGYIATPQWWRIGEMAYVAQTGKARSEGEGEGGYEEPLDLQWRKVLIADACNYEAGDCMAMIRKEIAFEVDYEMAEKWDIVGWAPKYNQGCVVVSVPSLEMIGKEAERDAQASNAMLEWVERHRAEVRMDSRFIMPVEALTP